jgi:NAD-dependent DNA ligase
MSRVQVLANNEENDMFSSIHSALSTHESGRSMTASSRGMNSNVRPLAANQQSNELTILMDSFTRNNGNMEAINQQRSLLQQYRMQHLQRYNQQHENNGPSWRHLNPQNNPQQNQHQHSHNQHISAMVSAAQGCPSILEGQIVCIGECTFTNDRSRLELYKTAQQLGAQLRKTFTTDCTLFITPYQTGIDFEQAVANTPYTQIVSLQWLEECIQAKNYIEPYKPHIHYPIRCSTGIPEMSKLVISVTGFVGEERNDLKFLIKACGAKYSGALSKKENTHLICCVPEGEKYQKALEWNIKVTNKRWLYDCVSEWNYCPEEYYSDINIQR